MSEKIFEGVCGSRGIIIGKVRVFEPDKVVFDYENVRDTKAEIIKFERARKKIVKEWKKISYGWRGVITKVIDAQIMILEDEEFAQKVKERIKEERR